MTGTDFSELAKEIQQVTDRAQKCGVTMDELNDCMKAMASQPTGHTIMDVKESSKVIAKILKKLKDDEIKNQKS